MKDDDPDPKATPDREEKFPGPRVGVRRTAVVVFAAVVLLLPPAARGRWGGYGLGRFGRYPGLYGGGYRGYGGAYGYGNPAFRAPIYPSYPPPGYGYGVQPYAAGYPPPAYQPQTYQQYQRPYAYPRQGQNPGQAGGDMTECQSWASAQTGYHPMAPGPSQASGGQQGGMLGSLLRGGAAGGAMGAVGGAIGGNAGKGAATGAAVGGLFSLLKHREEMQVEQQQQHQEQQAQAMAGAAYNRALQACLSGRGYSVR